MGSREPHFMEYDDEEASDEDSDDEFNLANDKTMHFEEVLQEELDNIWELDAQRPEDGRRRQPFSLAFSGGGIRAAAFQAGVLWRLAKEDKLKDVEYFTAVSGGGYITSAFASHCIGMPAPEDGESMRDWYLKVVARTLCRMQRNAGDFVRDCFKAPFAPEDGASWLPRVFDLPILLATVGFTLAINPVMFVIAVLVPFTVVCEMFFGGAMRAAFCYEFPFTIKWMALFSTHSHFPHIGELLVFLLVINLVFHILSAFIPGCKLQPSDMPPQNGRSARPVASSLYLFNHSTRESLMRFTWGALFLMIFIIFVPSLQIIVYGIDFTAREPYCAEYIAGRRSAAQTCADVHYASVWYEDPLFANYTKASPTTTASPFAPAIPAIPDGHTIPHLLADTIANSSKANPDDDDVFDHKRSLQRLLFFFVLAVVTCTIVVIPIVGTTYFVQFLLAVGPLALAVMMLAVVQFAVFGPVTKNAKGSLPYHPTTWENFASYCLLGTLFLLPVYEELRAILHTYYKRSLRGNFFHEGQEKRVVELKENKYCPFVILTGTSSDYMPPGDMDTISELSFSPLHCGGEETGYVRMPPYRQLSKITALTGAGCLDAISLSMNDMLAMRFWLEVLNLSWGDYIIFHHLGEFSWFLNGCGKLQGYLMRLLHRVPASLVWFGIFLLMNLGWQARTNSDVTQCEHSRNLCRIAVWIAGATVFLSFYAFLPPFDLLTLSPMIRQIHQATKYFYVGNRPPRMLYVTDGGVKDCTSLVQLLWRRRERILLVLAAADPRDELGVLKAAMKFAEDLKLATFYDPADPRKSVEVLLAEFKENKEQTHMHIGISYCWEDAQQGRRTGHLYIVKNRLPTSYEGRPVGKPLSIPEITGEDPMDEFEGEACDNMEADLHDPEQWDGITTDQLGPFGCCDCCHTNGMNCGPKFPHGSFTGYLYLSPTWMSSLCRLGFDLSGPAIEEVTKPGQLGESWERAC